jgi:hypothetical protein
MECIEVVTLSDLIEVYAFLVSQGATPTTPVVISSDEEGNQFVSGLTLDFDPNANITTSRWISAGASLSGTGEYSTETITDVPGAVFVFPHGNHVDVE